MPELITEREAAAFLRVAQSTLRTWRSQGTGPSFFRLGVGKRGAVRYDQRDLAAFVVAGRMP